jgi:hypothetical protein
MNYYVEPAVSQIAITAPAGAAGSDGQLLVQQWMKEAQHWRGPASRSVTERLPRLGAQMFDTAWEGALRLLRQRGGDPNAIIQRAASALNSWRRHDGEGPLDPDES